MRLTVQHTCSFCVCLLLSVTGLCFIFAWDAIFSCVLSIQCNPYLYSIWKVLPVDIPTEFYFFNWTNPEDLFKATVKPKFQEVGPYVFWQKEEKGDLVWNDNGTVTFSQTKFWHYDESRSRSLEDIITIVDTTSISVAYIVREWNYYVRKGIFLTLSPYFKSINRTQSVRELLFDGYPEPLVKILGTIPIFDYLKLPDWDRMGWMYSRNGSSQFDGVFNMDHSSNLGKILNWNYKDRTEYFEDECGSVVGSAGQFYQRNLKKETITLFSTDLRRVLSFKYAFERRVNGILGYTFIADNFTMDNGTINPLNKCFCADECMPSGLINISLTRHQSPLFGSLPHFYRADPYYINMVEGLKPDKEEHEIYITVEPRTGLVIDVDVKVQMNVLLQPISGTLMFQDVRRVFFPIIWSRQRTSLPDRESIILKLLLGMDTFHTVLGLGFILTAAAIVVYKWYKHKKVLQQFRVKGVDDSLLLHLMQIKHP